jgi:D-glycero-D-manno-heptose 1,7-bisphosphate phosphatase
MYMPMTMTKQAIRDVVFDRDGTLIVDKHYLSTPEGVELIPGSAEALAKLQSAGLRIHIASNQSGIGRGYFKEAEHLAVNARLLEILQQHGIEVQTSLFCPHAPDDACTCRKPAPGMWRELIKTCDAAPERSAVVGDKASDLNFGIGFGAALVVLVLTGKGTELARKMGLPQDLKHWEFFGDKDASRRAVAVDAAAACDCILEWNAEAGDLDRA